MPIVRRALKNSRPHLALPREECVTPTARSHVAEGVSSYPLISNTSTPPGDGDDIDASSATDRCATRWFADPFLHCGRNAAPSPLQPRLRVSVDRSRKDRRSEARGQNPRNRRELNTARGRTAQGRHSVYISSTEKHIASPSRGSILGTMTEVEQAGGHRQKGGLKPLRRGLR